MQLYILNESYERIGYLDECESVLWNKKYNDIGECEIYISCEEEMINLLKEGYFVYREDDDMFCQIQTVQIETNVESGDYIIATGKDMNSMLADRIVRWELTFKGKVVDFIKRIIFDNIINPAQEYRKIENFVVNEDNFAEFEDTLTINAFTEDLLELIRSLCTTYEYGFRISYNIEKNVFEFELYKGKNKATTSSEEYVEFSPTYANISSSNYKKDISNYKNLCYVGYKSDDEQLTLLSVYNTSTEPVGDDRKEMYIDGSSTSRDITYEELVLLFPDVQRNNSYYYTTLNNSQITVAFISEDKITISDYTYLTIIRNLGLNALAERNKTQEFTGEVDLIDTYEYKVDYDLGDIVKIKNEYGIEAEARIVEITESDDSEDGYIVEPVFEYIN